jgi:hypothetical protein
MKPDDFLGFALKLIQSDPSPAAMRSAVSRAYYAAFHSAKEFIEEIIARKLSDGPASHGEVVNHLAQTGDARVDEAGTDLGNLRGERNSAD